MNNRYPTRDAASVAAADYLQAALEKRLQLQAAASLVVSGGSTPGACFDALSQRELDWANVHVLMSDERWVAPDSDDSNERLVRESLLINRASAAQLLPVYAADSTPEQRCKELDATIRTLPFPFAATLLGMGEDGHFASLFPDADNLASGLDSDGADLVLPVSTAASPHPRISLTLAALSRSDVIALLVFGERKREVIEAATGEGSDLPIARLLRQKRAPVEVFWAP